MHGAAEVDELDVDAGVLRLKNGDARLVFLKMGVGKDPEFQFLATFFRTREDENRRDEEKAQHHHRSLAERETIGINAPLKHGNLL